VSDGDEDDNHNGQIDAGETDPNYGPDDTTVPPECDEDSDCGGPTSGTVCDDTTQVCIPGCRGQGGNGCPTDQICTSQDTTIGQCVDAPPQCVDDTDCGTATSGIICDAATGTCIPGCRGSGGNSCPDGQLCTSADATAGTCVIDEGGVIAEGAGCLCATQGAGDSGNAPWIAALAGLAGLILRRCWRS
jgi:MYXO-CTERM domain-containing protein